MRPIKYRQIYFVALLIFFSFSFHSAKKANCLDSSFHRQFLSSQIDTNEEYLVRDFLGNERFEFMSENNPGLIHDLKLRCKYGYQLVDCNPEKCDSYKKLAQIELSYKEGNILMSSQEFAINYENGRINPLRIVLPIDAYSNAFYKLEGTEKLLILNSSEHIKRISESSQN